MNMMDQFYRTSGLGFGKSTAIGGGFKGLDQDDSEEEEEDEEEEK